MKYYHEGPRRHFNEPWLREKLTYVSKFRDKTCEPKTSHKAPAESNDVKNISF